MEITTLLAPTDAVREFVRTFRGRFFPVDHPGYVYAQFDNCGDADSVLVLISKLEGWHVEYAPDYKHALRIWQSPDS